MTFDFDCRLFCFQSRVKVHLSSGPVVLLTTSSPDLSLSGKTLLSSRSLQTDSGGINRELCSQQVFHLEEEKKEELMGSRRRKRKMRNEGVEE